MSDAEYGEKLVRLASADNFRDVTGLETAYVAADGSVLRRGVLFRSNELQLTYEDSTSLERLGVTGVYDLREQHEADAHPDAAVGDAALHHLPVPGIPMELVADLSSPQQASEVMREVYRGFVTDERARASFAALLAGLAGTEGPQVFHCTAGKDRTGWAAALLLHLAGVDDAAILEDYLLTNTFSSATRDKYLALVGEHLGPEKVEVYDRVLVADETYLQAGYAAAAATYASREDYLREGLGLDGDTLDRLRARMQK